MKYQNLKTQLRLLDTVLKKKKDRYVMALAQYERELGALREKNEETDSNGPSNQELRAMIEKTELMRLVMSKLVMARTETNDGLADPRRKYALKPSR
ncbi:unnamed protein product [Parnassius apollo]|uniref:(apollo) hypothetical protein n=1 Tax=Parnassius apollo TaxID=110799 RepID=A0A8S3XE26_PARAO|nr:unnamed protein product [Parnassius apollo]